jgi:pyruvate,orthophosphate dikinase
VKILFQNLPFKFNLQRYSAVKYREINKVLGLRGTAVNIQAMVYGNMGDTSCSGVCFTRDPSTVGRSTLNQVDP